MEIPPAYVEDVKLLIRLLQEWSDTNPGARPLFRFPPETVLLIGSLDDAPSWLLGNDDARACVAWLDEKHPRATLFMLRVALGYLRKPAVAQ